MRLLENGATKLILANFLKTTTAWNFKKFFSVYPIRRLPKCIKTAALNTYVYPICSFFEKQREICNQIQGDLQLLTDQIRLSNCFYFLKIQALCIAIITTQKTRFPIYPPGMRRCSDVSFRSHKGRDVADHAKTSSRRRNWYVNETDLFEMSLRRLTGT